MDVVTRSKISQQDMLLCEGHQCYSDSSYNQVVIFIDY